MSEPNPQMLSVESETPAPDTPQPEAARPALSWRDVLRRWSIYALAGGGVFALDQIVKWLVAERLAIGESWEPIPAIGDFLKITRSFNTGAAFGMLPQASDIFLLLALITTVVFLFYYPRLPAQAWLSRISFGLISGGALSNALDRIRLGHVVDFVHVQLSPTLSNISNFADHAITLGVILLLVEQWLTDRREKQETAEPQEDGATAPENSLTATPHTPPEQPR